MDQPRFHHGCGAAWPSRREMNLRPGVCPSSAHAPSPYVLRGADGLRADHFYLTRSRTDWLSSGLGGTGRVCAGIASLSLFPVVVGSAATQQPSHDAIRSLRASWQRGYPAQKSGEFLVGLERGSGVLNVWKGGGGERVTICTPWDGNLEIFVVDFPPGRGGIWKMSGSNDGMRVKLSRL